MASDLKFYNIFVGSPGGLDKERRAFRATVEKYNASDAIPSGVMFNPVGWEDTLPGYGRPQGIINEDLKTCDFAVIMLHDRWGSHPGDNAFNATSGTQEEYSLVLQCIKDKDLPMLQMILLFKAVPMRQLSDPGKELKKVLKFRRQIEDGKTLIQRLLFNQ